MTPDRWKQIEQVLDAALERTPHEWPAVLDEACADDADLRREVELLLQRYPEAEHFLAGFATEVLAPDVPADAAAPLEGRHIGPYRLVRVLARGGMGTVFLAERDTGTYRQQVALKILRPGLDTEDGEHRFRAEQQILASLTHPGIACLLDGGVTDPGSGPGLAGQPFLAMEYVEGRPIDQYCDEHRLPVNERLKLFARVCDAVHYAHRNLVVHRDLKPSNILVIEDPGSGPGQAQVKLLDFGIAKLLDDEAALATVPQTRTGQRWMTPEYAAPEQITGAAITTATDTYQLGVVLYELLTGHRPFEPDGDSLHAVEQAVLEEDPEKPSTAVSRVTERAIGEAPTRIDAAQVSRARSTQPERLRRTLQGDLDMVVLKALRKEPGARYASAEAFLEDIKRYLGGLPVEARRGTAGYRARKFVRRHQWGVTAVGAFVLVLAGYAVTVTVQANRIASERDRAEQVTAFMGDLFQEFEPVETRGSTLEAHDVLDRSVERIRQELPDQPLLRAKLLDTIGRVYENWGLFPEAERVLEEALAIRQQLLGPRHLDVADSQLELAILRYTTSQPGTEPLFEAAIATFRDRLGPDHPQTVYALTNRAIALRARGAYAAAEALFREILATIPHEETNTHAALARTYLGKLLTQKGAYEEADEVLRDALAARRAELGTVHPVVANVLDARGELMLARGDPEAAEQLFQEALAMRRTFFEDDHPDIAAGQSNLALARYARGDYAAAEALLHDALAIYRSTFGETSTDVAELYHSLASVYEAQDDPEAAHGLYRKALAIWRQQPQGETHPKLAHLLLDFATLRIRQGTPHRAEPLLREALAIRQQVFPGRDWQTAEAQIRLGHNLMLLGRYAEAEPLLAEGYADLKAARGEEDRYTQEALEHLVALYEAWDKPDRATAFRTLPMD